MASPPHRHAQQLADQNLVLAVILLPSFARPLARDFVLLPAVDLALFVAEVRPSVADAAEEPPRRSSFGLTGEAGCDWHRGRAGVVFFRRGDFLLLGAVVRVDSVFESHMRE